MRTMRKKLLMLCIVVSVLVGLTVSPAEAATILYQSPNTDIDLSMPYTSLEFENPLAGTEMIKGYAVKEWMDADYAAGPPRWYDDWNVNDSAGIDGYANEIWMRWAGHSIWTSSTIPSTAVSIHLHGDDNDGLADVLVDGILVARLDMGTRLGTQNALIIVKDLAHITHHIRVNDLGVGPNTGQDDVATMGAAALEQRIKWSQPPKPTTPDNLYYGWNEISIYDGNQIVADDWRCDNDDPVTDIHWWGSFKGWNNSDQPPADESPTSFHITIWNDIPANTADPNSFSHPNEVVWETDCYNFTTKFVGWDYDPRTNCFETCFYYEQDLTEAQYFYQRTNPSGAASIYWISIAAQYPAALTTDHQWGWKTRRRFFNDDAVKIRKPTMPHIGDKYQDGKPIYWPDETQSWDMAFELTSRMTTTAIKWEHPPNQELPGLHCHDYISLPGGHQWTTIADDWRCDGGAVTELHWWGNYETDTIGNEMRGSEIRNFHLSIHNPDPTVNCLPEQNEIFGFDVPLGDVTVIDTGMVNIENSKIYRYEYVLPTPFPQELGRYYWLDITAFANDPQDPARWRWQESKRDIRANITLCPAVKRTEPPVPGPWQTIVWTLYDPERYSEMAFAIISTGFGQSYTKWAQRPEPYTQEAFDGWNELSVYYWNQIVADDWFCDTDNPVTDVHWWGSFLGWSCEGQPPQIPDSFHIAIWTDVPAGADPNPDVYYSHPGVVIWETVCNNFTSKFVGWDIDPRDPNAPPEACFKFEQDLPEEEWFKQKPGGNIYWISIAARYPTGTSPMYPWGWKTRLRDLNSRAPDDAVRIFNPTDPVLGSPYLFGEPIFWPTQTMSWDMAFELTTKEIPPKKPVPHLKWSQPPIEVDPNSRIPVYSGWDELSYAAPIAGTYDNMRVVADDYRCLGSMPVTSIHWWGSYYGMVEPGTTPPELPTAWKIGFWSNVPAPDGEWDLGDSHKMHYPQLPDPTGWDLDFTSINKSADDWRCTKSGPVTDIHFWYSWRGDIVGTIEAIKVEIYKNVPKDPGDPTSYSHPGTLEWNQGFLPGQFTTRFWGKGDQGFMTAGQTPITNDHKNIYQCNIVDILPPLFYQNVGEVYWLAITIEIRDPLNTHIGWKTTDTQFLDDAVFGNAAGGWSPWKDPFTGESLDLAFVITDDPNYSRPEKLLWTFEVPADRVEVEEVGTDFYHHYYPNDVAYQYTLNLGSDEIFWQGDYLDRTKDDVFWLSIVAVYDSAAGTDPVHPWGWKTRPWHWMDDAVRFMFNGPLDPGIVLDPHMIEPIKDPIYRESFDVAFELDTDPNYIKWEQPFIGIRRWPHYEDEKSMARVVTTTEHVTKWLQRPDLTVNGIDVDATHLDLITPTPFPQLLADDFECVTAETIDDIHVYGSWRLDEPPNGDPKLVDFTLSIHEDLPIGDPRNPYTWSIPGDMLWSEDFAAGDFTVDLLPTTAPESYYMPCTGDYFPNDHYNVYKYNFYPIAPFLQKGSTTNRIIYWLDVQARPRATNPDTRFGWKTRDLIDDGHFMDDAAWVSAIEPYNGINWRELLYPPGHPLGGQSMDLAFELTSDVVTTEFIIDRLVADDWRCDHNTPVTDAVWWGSYIGYQYKPCHGQFMPLPVKPDYFLLTIWTDVPANADSTIPFSHPNDIIWEYKAYDYDEVLVGYDKHPHATPGAERRREPVFRYSVRLPEESWFQQRNANDIYWFSVVAVYEAGTDPLYDWGWTNHKHVFNDDAVAGSYDPAVGEWSWTELLDQIQMSQDMSFMLFTDPDCFPYDHPDYSEWLSVGKPDCWCCPRQCHGNATPTCEPPEGSAKAGYWYVGLNDLNILVSAWKILEPAVAPTPSGPGVGSVPNGICADFDHAKEGSVKAGFWRVGLNDLNILVANWKILEPAVLPTPGGPGVPPDCLNVP
ncbi:MAG: hypothetical protein OEW48_06595 [Phycisphaerae bacterium]|nr:hypothetical protein [Phycisphaerae bacterium]